jgi:hypothetical protein
MPSVVYGNGSIRNNGWFKPLSTPECQSQANMITWEYPVRGDLPPLNVHWYDGGLKPHRPQELDFSLNLPKSGLLFVGEHGKIISGYGGGNPFNENGRTLNGGLLLPENKFRDFEEPVATLPRIADHYGNWTNACKTGSDTDCPIVFGCEMTEIALLGALALRTDQLLEWDAKAMRVTNRDEKVNTLVDPEYRKGWTI